jgi:hypothetical protein
MKMLMLTGALLACFSLQAQKKANVTIDSKGNFVSVKKDTASKATPTGRYYIDRAGSMWPVFKTDTGRLYALRTSKAGKEYKYYLKPDTDTTNWEGN